MSKYATTRSDLVDTPWQTCPGLRAGAIDGAASLIVMEILVDALSRLPEGRSAIAAAYRRRSRDRTDEHLGASPVDIAAGALALALIEAAAGLDVDPAPQAVAS